ncbi:MAG: Hsp70 family protein, partial [Chloroflexota bacterium]|nr:Hsp70 family protein [Chloroflexota bacterium]
GIPPAPRGVPQVDVTFDIDANGILNVTAKDLGSGKEQNVTIHASTTLSKEQVDQMVKEAEEHADDDRARAEEVELRNRADTLLYQTERTLKDLGEDDIPEEDRAAVESALENLREALKGEDTASISAAVEEVQQASMKIGEAMYAKSGAAQGEDGDPVGAAPGPQASNGDANDDTVVDAEFRATDESDAEEKADASESEKR